MKVIAVLNEKGGCGKTTIATNLARSLQLEGFNTIIVDSDVQGSARDWAAASDTDVPAAIGMDRPTLHKDISKVAESADFVVIDGAARPALCIRHLVERNRCGPRSGKTSRRGQPFGRIRDLSSDRWHQHSRGGSRCS